MRLAAICGIAVFASGFAISAEGPTFDVASVKLAASELRPPFAITGGPGTNDPGRFSAPHIGMFALLERAFGVETDQIAGPAWLRGDVGAAAPSYTVVATMPADTTKEQFQKVLQNLLVERFHLVFHRETKSFPGYELVVDEGGPKFKEVAPTQSADPCADRDPRANLRAPRGADGFPNFPGPATIMRYSKAGGGQQATKYQERTMAEFVSNLGNLIGRSLDAPAPRVVDKTGLTGKYSFVLEYYSQSLANLRPARSDTDTANGSPPAASDPGGGPNIFVAIQKQLGLRLDKMADVPQDTIVVESVDKVPTED